MLGILAFVHKPLPSLHDAKQRAVTLQMLRDHMQDQSVSRSYVEDLARQQQLTVPEAWMRVILAKDALNRYVH
jgi:hypothetical protein